MYCINDETWLSYERLKSVMISLREIALRANPFLIKSFVEPFPVSITICFRVKGNVFVVKGKFDRYGSGSEATEMPSPTIEFLLIRSTNSSIDVFSQYK